MKGAIVVAVGVFTVLGLVAEAGYGAQDLEGKVMALLLQTATPRVIDDEAAWRARAEAEKALVGMGEAAEEPLLRILGDESQSVRTRCLAMRALGGLRSKRAVPSLVKLIGDDLDVMTHAALKSLGQIGSPEAVDALIREVKRSETSLVSYYASEELRSVSNPEAVSVLKDALRDENTNVVTDAQESLAKVGTKDAIMALGQSMYDKRPGIRSGAAKTMASVSSGDALSFLRDALTLEESELVRAKILAGLAMRGDGLALKELCELAARDDPANADHRLVRSIAIKALGDSGDRSVVPLLRRLLYEADPTVKSGALTSLDSVGDESVIPDLKRLIEGHEIEMIREQAQKTMDKIKARIEKEEH